MKNSLYAARMSAGIPSGSKRNRAFPGEVRGRIVTRDNLDFYEVEGYASVFNRGYEMWDLPGPYTELVDSQAFDKTLAAKPDVVFLVNHTGMSMARTANGSLQVYRDSTGLGMKAWLNPTRHDVQDLMSAIGDKLITEMSFAFMLNDGKWENDFTTYRIVEADLERGDVSAVNYGANPYTSITARADAWLKDIDRMPEPVLIEARQRLNSRIKTSAVEDKTAGSTDNPKDSGISVAFLRSRYLSDEEAA